MQTDQIDAERENIIRKIESTIELLKFLKTPGRDRDAAIDQLVELTDTLNLNSLKRSLAI